MDRFDSVASGVAELVKIAETREEGLRDAQGDLGCQGSLAGFASMGEELGQRAAVDVFEGQEVLTGDLTPGDDVNEVGVVELFGEAGLVGKHISEGGILSDLRQKELDHDERIVRGSVDTTREVDFGHAAYGEAPEELELAKASVHAPSRAWRLRRR